MTSSLPGVSTSLPESHLVLPRGLIFFAALWLAGSVALAMGFRTPVHATAASLEPGIRLMLQCVVLGLVIAWPLLRLSQQATRLPMRQTLLDLVALLTLLQIVIWVPRIFTIWTISRTAAIDSLLASWTVMVGAIVASVIGTNRASLRLLAMAACVAIALIGPVALWLGWPRDLILLGPFMGIAHLMEGGATRPSVAQWQSIIVLAGAAVAAWLALGAAIGLQRMAGHRD